jgi:hypothetical protein
VYVFPRTDRGVELRNHESDNRNIIIFATRDAKRKTRNELLSLAQAHTRARDKSLCVEPQTFQWHAENVYVDGPTDPQLAGIPVLTDEYAPVDTMYRPVKYDEYVYKIR